MAVTLTEVAANEIKRIISENSLPESTMLRIRVGGGGCSGLDYQMGLDEKYNETEDMLSEQHGVKVVVDKKSDLFLDGLKVDYHAGIERRGFVFDNPNARNTCGCGRSFSA